jgi:hypothetical protein
MIREDNHETASRFNTNTKEFPKRIKKASTRQTSITSRNSNNSALRPIEAPSQRDLDTGLGVETILNKFPSLKGNKSTPNIPKLPYYYNVNN